MGGQSCCEGVVACVKVGRFQFLQNAVPLYHLVVACNCLPLSGRGSLFLNLNHKSSSLKVQKGAKNGKLSHIHNKKEGKALQLKKSFKGIFKFKTDSLMDPMGKLKLNIRFKSEKSQTWTWKA